MKTRILFAFLIMALAVQSQSLVLTYEGETLEPNDEVTVEGSPWGLEIVVEMDVTNTSGSNISVLIQRYEDNMLPTTTSGLCWGLCYPPNVGLTPTALTVNAGQTNDSDFSGHYYPSNKMGMSTISYVFFDENNPNDSTMVTVNFIGDSPTGIEDNNKVVATAYPNPANEKLMVNLNQQTGRILKVELLSMNGRLIESISTINGIAIFSTSDLENGIYFYRVLDNEQPIYSNRVIIKH